MITPFSGTAQSGAHAFSLVLFSVWGLPATVLRAPSQQCSGDRPGNAWGSLLEVPGAPLPRCSKDLSGGAKGSVEHGESLWQCSRLTSGSSAQETLYGPGNGTGEPSFRVMAFPPTPFLAHFSYLNH